MSYEISQIVKKAEDPESNAMDLKILKPINKGYQKEHSLDKCLIGEQIIYVPYDRLIIIAGAILI